MTQPMLHDDKLVRYDDVTLDALDATGPFRDAVITIFNRHGVHGLLACVQAYLPEALATNSATARHHDNAKRAELRQLAGVMLGRMRAVVESDTFPDSRRPEASPRALFMQQAEELTHRHELTWAAVMSRDWQRRYNSENQARPTLREFRQPAA